jgi:predicted  nucleic acid-binding Zn-ribbon protein
MACVTEARSFLIADGTWRYDIPAVRRKRKKSKAKNKRVANKKMVKPYTAPLASEMERAASPQPKVTKSVMGRLQDVEKAIQKAEKAIEEMKGFLFGSKSD